MIFRKNISGICACGVSSVGKVRENNEDNLYVNGCYPNPEQISDISEPIVLERSSDDIHKMLLCAVFDGMGGESCGELASETAVRTLAKKHNDIASPDEMDHVIEQINDAVFAISKENGLSACGTTAAVALIHQNNLYAFNVGDSRIYLIRKHSIECLSTDDTQAQLFVSAGLMKKTEVARSPMKHVLTQYIGMDTTVSALNIHKTCMRLIPGDRILLCSDGVTDALDDDRIKTIIRDASSVRIAAESLISASNSEGGKDNATAIVLEVS